MSVYKFLYIEEILKNSPVGNPQNKTNLRRYLQVLTHIPDILEEANKAHH